ARSERSNVSRGIGHSSYLARCARRLSGGHSGRAQSPWVSAPNPPLEIPACLERLERSQLLPRQSLRLPQSVSNPRPPPHRQSTTLSIRKEPLRRRWATSAITRSAAAAPWR